MYRKQGVYRGKAQGSGAQIETLTDYTSGRAQEKYTQRDPELNQELNQILRIYLNEEGRRQKGHRVSG